MSFCMQFQNWLESTEQQWEESDTLCSIQKTLLYIDLQHPFYLWGYGQRASKWNVTFLYFPLLILPSLIPRKCALSLSLSHCISKLSCWFSNCIQNDITAECYSVTVRSKKPTPYFSVKTFKHVPLLHLKHIIWWLLFRRWIFFLDWKINYNYFYST